MLRDVNAPLTPAPVTVWIAPGCTRCRWCQHLLPTVFEDSPAGSQVRAEARCDSDTCSNEASRSPIKPGHLDASSSTFLDFVADGCPAQVIKVER